MNNSDHISVNIFTTSLSLEQHFLIIVYVLTQRTSELTIFLIKFYVMYRGTLRVPSVPVNNVPALGDAVADILASFLARLALVPS